MTWSKVKHELYWDTYQHLPKIPRTDILLLWAMNWGQGPLDGVALYKGEKYRYETIRDATTDTGHHIRHYLLVQLTPWQREYFDWERWEFRMAVMHERYMDEYDGLPDLNPAQDAGQYDLAGVLPTSEEIMQVWIGREQIEQDQNSETWRMGIEALDQQSKKMRSLRIAFAPDAIVGWFEQPLHPDEPDEEIYS